MTPCFCISVRFLQPYSHARDENGDPEWPPSPLRLIQSLVAASAGRWNERTVLATAVPALRWLESLPAPRIVAARAKASKSPYRLYVPDNVADKAASSWSRGRQAAVDRTEKDVRPAHLDGAAVHYIYALMDETGELQSHMETIALAARAMTHLGWGIDMATGDAAVLSAEQAAEFTGDRWLPSPRGGRLLRTPKPGTLDDLARKHADFLGRLSAQGFRPVPPLRVFDLMRYRRQDDPLPRPHRVFELRDLDGSRFRYPHRRLIHIAGMVRHLAIEAMKKSPPRGVDAGWVDRYVAGHAADDKEEHRQLSYLPLPSMGHQHADPGVRRVMIAAPVGDDDWLDHVARRLAGQVLRPVNGNEFPGRQQPILVPVRRDNIARFYTEPTNIWHSFTPVILPGHDDHKPDKTRALIERALVQSGIDQPCEFEWSAFSRFPKAYSAHKYDKQGQPQGYIRPDHLLTQTAVHLTIRFKDGLRVPGPIAIGAGRHCGFGLMARIDE